MERHPEAHLVQCLAIDVIHALMQGDPALDARSQLSFREEDAYDPSTGGYDAIHKCEPDLKCIELLVKVI